jgi:hypothetical protein
MPYRSTGLLAVFLMSCATVWAAIDGVASQTDELEWIRQGRLMNGLVRYTAVSTDAIYISCWSPNTTEGNPYVAKLSKNITLMWQYNFPLEKGAVPVDAADIGLLEGHFLYAVFGTMAITSRGGNSYAVSLHQVRLDTGFATTLFVETDGAGDLASAPHIAASYTATGVVYVSALVPRASYSAIGGSPVATVMWKADFNIGSISWTRVVSEANYQPSAHHISHVNSDGTVCIAESGISGRNGSLHVTTIAPDGSWKKVNTSPMVGALTTAAFSVAGTVMYVGESPNALHCMLLPSKDDIAAPIVPMWTVAGHDRVADIEVVESANISVFIVGSTTTLIAGEVGSGAGSSVVLNQVSSPVVAVYDLTGKEVTRSVISATLPGTNETLQSLAILNSATGDAIVAGSTIFTAGGIHQPPRVALAAFRPDLSGRMLPTSSEPSPSPVAPILFPATPANISAGARDIAIGLGVGIACIGTIAICALVFAFFRNRVTSVSSHDSRSAEGNTVLNEGVSLAGDSLA